LAREGPHALAAGYLRAARLCNVSLESILDTAKELPLRVSSPKWASPWNRSAGLKRRVFFSDDARAGIRAIQRLRVGDFRVRFTEEGVDTLRIHAVKNRKGAHC